MTAVAVLMESAHDAVMRVHLHSLLFGRTAARLVTRGARVDVEFLDPSWLDEPRWRDVPADDVPILRRQL